MFKKAEAKQAKLKLGIYGPQGSGKSFTSLQLAEGLAKREGKRIAYIDTEHGTDFYSQAVPQRAFHPEAFDFDALYTRSIADVLKSIETLDPAVYGVLVIDSISHVWDAAMEAYDGDKTSQGGIPMHAWSQIKKPYKAIMRHFLSGNFHAILCGRQKNIFDKSGGELTKVGVGMRAEGETEYEPHICLRMESRKSENDSSKSTVAAICEKDRTGILQGRTIPNPNFTMLEPILALLGNEQAVQEDPDDVQARDAALLDETSKKTQAKAEKSLASFREFTTRIHTVNSDDALNEIAREIGVQQKTKGAVRLIKEHLESLRQIVAAKRNELAVQV